MEYLFKPPQLDDVIPLVHLVYLEPSIPLLSYWHIVLKLETSHVNLTFSNNIQYSESENFIYIFWI